MIHGWTFYKEDDSIISHQHSDSNIEATQTIEAFHSEQLHKVQNALQLMAANQAKNARRECKSIIKSSRINELSEQEWNSIIPLCYKVIAESYAKENISIKSINYYEEYGKHVPLNFSLLLKISELYASICDYSMASYYARQSYLLAPYQLQWISLRTQAICELYNGNFEFAQSLFKSLPLNTPFDTSNNEIIEYINYLKNGMPISEKCRKNSVIYRLIENISESSEPSSKSIDVYINDAIMQTIKDLFKVLLSKCKKYTRKGTSNTYIIKIHDNRASKDHIDFDYTELSKDIKEEKKYKERLRVKETPKSKKPTKQKIGENVRSTSAIINIQAFCKLSVKSISEQSINEFLDYINKSHELCCNNNDAVKKEMQALINLLISLHNHSLEHFTYKLLKFCFMPDQDMTHSLILTGIIRKKALKLYCEYSKSKTLIVPVSIQIIIIECLIACSTEVHLEYHKEASEIMKRIKYYDCNVIDSAHLLLCLIILKFSFHKGARISESFLLKFEQLWNNIKDAEFEIAMYNNVTVINKPTLKILIDCIRDLKIFSVLEESYNSHK